MRNYGEDGSLFRSEECDDSNLLDGDGCSKKCDMETGFNCKGESVSVFGEQWFALLRKR